LDEKLQKKQSKDEEVLGENFIGSEKKNNNSLRRMRIAPYAFHREWLHFLRENI
jgi:hypothetical protein